MSTARTCLAQMLCVLLIASAASAQTTPTRGSQEPTPVTLVTESDRVRFTTSATALEWRLEVATQEGAPVFDSGAVTGTALEWPLVDGQGQPVDAALYSYTLTIRTDAANVRVQRGQLQVERLQRMYRVAVVAGEGFAPSGITLNIIDAGDVAPPGSPATAGNAGGTTVADSIAPAPAPIGRNLRGVSFGALISGSGTTNVMTKWLDGPAGLVGDANVAEAGGSVVIGNGSFIGNLHIFGAAGNDVFAGMGPNPVAGPAFTFGYAGATFGRSAGFFNVRADAFALPPNPSLRFMTANLQRMIITGIGNVGIGTTVPNIRLVIRSTGVLGSTQVLRIEDAIGNGVFDVDDEGVVRLSKLVSSTGTTHVCHTFNALSTCGSAAEYVPTIAGTRGYPMPAELVSLSPRDPNPYGDARAPFVVTKSSRPCDAHVLGFIVDPESGAEGKKLNEHYLPLAIYGYFPARVTMEHGPIRRGDSITSSSTPGAGMKATGSCRIIGYALEDAEKDGTIQVFANLGEQAAPDAAAWRGQIDALRHENVALKQGLAALEARLAALERGAARPDKRER